jgi:methionine-rich copper-binding protein CopC
MMAYPVPASDKVTLEFGLPTEDEVSLTLYNAKGGVMALLYTGKVEANSIHSIEVNTNALQSGMYVVRLSGKSAVKLQKLIISR